MFLFRLQEKNDFEKDNQHLGPVCVMQSNLCQTGNRSIPCPVREKSDAASEAQPHPQISPSFFSHSTTNLENLTLIPTVFSIWAEMRTMHFILTKLQLHFKFHLVWSLFHYPPKQIRELGDFGFFFFGFVFFSFAIFYQGLSLLILSASCYLKPTSTEMCVFAGRLHQTFIVQYCDSWWQAYTLFPCLVF